MSRSGYSEDCDNLNLYRSTVERALHGKRGQAFLMELIAALDALPSKTLIYGELINANGECCAIGAVCKSRSLDVSKVDYDDQERMGRLMGIAPSMAAEIAYMNDEWTTMSEDPARRWERMRKWAVENIKETSVLDASETTL